MYLLYALKIADTDSNTQTAVYRLYLFEDQSKKKVGLALEISKGYEGRQVLVIHHYSVEC